MEEDIKKELEKYKRAKTILEYNFILQKAKKEDGTVDQEKLQKLLKQKYDNLISFCASKGLEGSEFQKNKEKLDEYFTMLKDRESRKYYEQLEYREKIMNNNYIDDGMTNVDSTIIQQIKYIDERREKTRSIQIVVSPNNEKRKNVIIDKVGTLGYKTAFNVIAKIDIYEIVKNINGLDRKFIVATNSDFSLAEKLIKDKDSGKELSTIDEEYLENINKQLSDVNLLSCQRQTNGYIGTAYKGKNDSSFEFEQEEYAAFNKFLEERIPQDDIER